MFLFLRSSEIAIDTRLQRYSRALAAEGIAHGAVYWKRGAEPELNSPMLPIPFDAPLAYRSRKKTALRLLALNVFAIHEIWKRRHEVTLIHAVDLDTAIAAWVAGKLTDIPYVYDVYDHYQDSRGITGWARKLAGGFDRLIMRDAAHVILADQCRIGQHDGVPERRHSIIENVPDFRSSRFRHRRGAIPTAGVPLHLGYLGTLEAGCRGIEDLLAVVCSMPGIELDIAGSGALENHVREAAKACPRIRFHGTMPHAKGLAMLESCHVVVGLYYSCNPNHAYASPNKYYEHLLLGRPMLTSNGTPPGNKVTRYETGWAVRDGREAIRAALLEMLAEPEKLEKRGNAAARLWDGRYASYATQSIQKHYVALARNLARPSRNKDIASALKENF